MKVNVVLSGVMSYSWNIRTAASLVALLAGGMTIRRPRRSVSEMRRPRSALAKMNSGCIWMLPIE